MKSVISAWLVRGVAVGLLVSGALASAQNAATYELPSDTVRYSQNPGTPWPAVDELGRVLPTAAEVGPPRPNRFTGIFYFLWLGQHDKTDKQPFVVTRHTAPVPRRSEKPWLSSLGSRRQSAFLGRAVVRLLSRL